jgi:hypothetical protein
METVEIIQPNSRLQEYRDDIVNMEFPVWQLDDRAMRKMVTTKRKKSVMWRKTWTKTLRQKKSKRISFTQVPIFDQTCHLKRPLTYSRMPKYCEMVAKWSMSPMWWTSPNEFTYYCQSNEE